MKKFSLLGILIIGFMLEGCSYSSPKEAYDVNITGKNALQKTNATTSRRYPDGNKIIEENSESKNSESFTLKKNDSNYDAYQHYQSNKPPKKAKRRPILNLKELNDLMDREATITLTERRIKNEEQPKIDADSNIQEVIEYNKKKRVKVLVVKKDETPVKKTLANTAPVKTTSSKKVAAEKKPAAITTKSSTKSSAIASNEIKTTNNKNLSSETAKIPEPNIVIPDTKPKNNNAAVANPKAQKTTTASNESKVSTPAISNSAVNANTSDITMPKAETTIPAIGIKTPDASIITPETSSAAVETKTPDASMPTPEASSAAVEIKTPDITMPELDSTNSAINTNASDKIIPEPVSSTATNNNNLDTISADNPTTETEMSPVDLSTDTSDMTQKELEQHLKAKFNSESQSDQDLLDEESTNSQMDDIDSSFDSNIPLPAIPSASSFNSTLSSLNELFISYYYKVKLSIMSFISSLFGLDW